MCVLADIWPNEKKISVRSICLRPGYTMNYQPRQNRSGGTLGMSFAVIFFMMSKPFGEEGIFRVCSIVGLKVV